VRPPLFLLATLLETDALPLARSFKNPNSDSSKWLTGKQLAEFYNQLVEKYDIVSIEDPFDQDDWEAWSHLTQNTKIQVRLLPLLGFVLERARAAS